jgi:hypothetical protein
MLPLLFYCKVYYFLDPFGVPSLCFKPTSVPWSYQSEDAAVDTLKQGSIHHNETPAEILDHVICPMTPHHMYIGSPRLIPDVFWERYSMKVLWKERHFGRNNQQKRKMLNTYTDPNAW